MAQGGNRAMIPQNNVGAEARFVVGKRFLVPHNLREVAKMKRLLMLLVLVLAVPVRAEVTFSFDDGSRTQIDHGYPVLKKFGYPATIYLVTKYMGHDEWYLDWGNVKILTDAGWDAECHTRTHPHLDTLTHKQLVSELDGCIHDLRWHGYLGRHFATPFGETDPTVQRELKKRFVSVRAGEVIGNELNWENKLNRYQLSIYPLNEDSDLELMKRLIEHGTFEKRWLIFMVHQVFRDGDPRLKTDKWSVSVSKLRAVAAYCNVQGTKVITVKQYFDEHGVN
jgi:peptidoglycan/xylan/chitin deacetylase (PgdA/CDA1 family)